MSAWIVSKAHIDAMVTAGLEAAEWRRLSWYAKNETGQRVSRTLDYTNTDEIGQMLLDANVASVGYRYPDDDLTDLPGPTNASYVLPYKFARREGEPTVSMLKQVACYEYQSCERDDWDESEAKAFCIALRDKLIGELPGYEPAPWGIE